MKLILLIFPGFAALAAQLLTAPSLSEALIWPLNQPVAFLVTWAILTSGSALMTALTGRLSWGLLAVSGPYLILATVSFFKQMVLGLPLLPWDFALVPALIGILPNYLGSPFMIGAGLCAIALTLFFVLAWPRIPAGRWGSWKARLGCGIPALFAFLVLMLARNPVHDGIFGRLLHATPSEPQKSIGRNGLLANLILIYEAGQYYPSTSFSRDEFERIHSRFDRGGGTTLPRVLPDVVVVMSESLFDPLTLRGIRWKTDPLRFTRSLAGRAPLSRTVVPVFGGGTAITEFEFLTGHSSRFFSAGLVPYEGMDEDRRLSILDSFKAAGYSAVAIHPGVRDYFNRERVYRALGFDHYVSGEGFRHRGTYGHYISDASVLEELKDSLASQTGPSFHFLVTLQNHGPFNKNPFEEKVRDFDPEGMERDEQIVLQYYSTIAKASDDFHRDLVSFLEKRGTPAVVLIFGDHLPTLMENMGVFHRRLVDSRERWRWTPEEARRVFQTPLAVWSNIGLEDEAEPVGTSFLGVRLASRLGLPLAPYHRFVDSVSRRLRILHPEFQVPLDPETERLLTDYQNYQYGTLMNLLPFAAQTRRLGGTSAVPGARLGP